MKSSHKLSLLTAAALSAALASTSQAAFNYDLRFDPSTPGLTDAHNLNLTNTGTYTLQLWGQITGDTNLSNDGWIYGFVGVSSAQSAGGALTAGGVTAASLGDNVQVAAGGPSNGVNNIITNDNISDWGGSSTGSISGWLKWVGGANPGFPDGVAQPGLSEQVNANTWEILLATFTVDVTSLGTGATTFNVVHPKGIKSGVATLFGIVYYLDNTSIANGETATSVTFTTPEPASLSLLSLASLPLLTRRRKPA